MPQPYLLEICCDSYEDALAAQAGGAHRIELCAELPTGGLTPDFALFQKIKAALDIPVFVLIRCHEGGFFYKKVEIDLMVRQIQEFVKAGADGIVCGALTANGDLDLSATTRFIEAAQGLPFTFHRAFDEVKHPEQALEQLISLGCNRILTSGQKKTALEGISLLKKLQSQAGERLTILVAGSVRPNNFPTLLQYPEFKEFHSAARPSAGERVKVEWVEMLAIGC
jgi:copper homeostasis protein